MSCRTTFPNMNIPKNTWPNIRGSSSVVTYPAIDENERAQTRFLLRRAWQTEPKDSNNRKTTNFRYKNNAGDFLSRVNYSCSKYNQNCDNSGIPPANCNVRYVYDSSDYIRYKKMSAINNEYNALGKKQL